MVVIWRYSETDLRFHVLDRKFGPKTVRFKAVRYGKSLNMLKGWVSYQGKSQLTRQISADHNLFKKRIWEARSQPHCEPLVAQQHLKPTRIHLAWTSPSRRRVSQNLSGNRRQVHLGDLLAFGWFASSCVWVGDIGRSDVIKSEITVEYRKYRICNCWSVYTSHVPRCTHPRDSLLILKRLVAL